MRMRIWLIIGALFAALISTPAHALPAQVHSIKAPFVPLYAKTGGVATVKSFTTRSAYIEKSSSFTINYSQVPEDYKPAIQAAVDVWAKNFKSNVPITVSVLWEVQANHSVLAAASPGRFFNGFNGAPDASLWYASAMANSLAGKDLDPVNAEVIIRLNSTNGPTLYLGTDGNCPRDKFDLESILLHELGHGLGFLSNAEYDRFGNGSVSQPTPYDAYAQLSDGRRLMDLPNGSAETGRAMTSSLVWSGASGIKANNGVKPKLYTPNPYEPGSSISHLDENTFANTASDSVMTPNLTNGEVFHAPGPVAIAMLEDMLIKPPLGVPVGIPQAPNNVKALVGDKSAVIYFDPPVNSRSAQVSSYKIKITPSGIEKTVSASPATITGLKNGTSYTFTITAINELGISEGAVTNAVIPQPIWKSSVIDPEADGKYLAQGIYAGKQIILYSDTKHGLLKMATYVNGKWQIKVIDGDSTSGGRTKNDVSGNISICTGKVGAREYLNVFYADKTGKDLRSAEFDGKKWSYSIVDGNAEKIQDYKEVERVRTGSDVTSTSACVRTTAGLQVFYRDDSQGILLGAVKDGKNWLYEIVDGDKETGGRSTGDVAFHLSAKSVGDKVYVGYDSVLSIDNERRALRGEVRLATRTTSNPDDWEYKSIQNIDATVLVSGFDVSLLVQGKSVYGAWLTASAFSIPNASQVSFGVVSSNSSHTSVNPSIYGAPTAPVSIGDKAVTFSCAKRLCSINRTDQTISLVSSRNFETAARSEWLTIKGVRYLLINSGEKLSLFKQP